MVSLSEIVYKLKIIYKVNITDLRKNYNSYKKVAKI